MTVGGIAYLLNYSILKYGQKFKYAGRVGIGFLGVLLLYFVVARNSNASRHMNYNIIANLIIALVESAFVSLDQENKLFTMKVPQSIEPFLIRDSQYKGSNLGPSQANVRNVILYVMESVPAEYVAGYSKKYFVTPHIEGSLSQAMLFTDIYAHTHLLPIILWYHCSDLFIQ